MGLKQAIKQTWTDGKNKKHSYHRSFDDIALFGKEINKDRWWVTKGDPVSVVVMSEMAQRIDESKHGVWMK